MAVLDLFSGAGGLSLGFKQAGFEILAGVEKEEVYADTFQNNIKKECFILDLSKQPKIPVDYNNVDVLIGGPPCQGFSLSGNRDVDDERNSLISVFLDYVEAIDPKTVVIENVEGIKSLGEEFELIQNKLNSYGYFLNYYQFDCSKYNVPQKRERVIVIADKKYIPNKPMQVNNTPKVKDFIYDIDEDHVNHEIPNQDDNTIQRIAQTNQGEPLYENYNQRIRLNENELAPTIVCGGTRPQPQLAHPKEDRGLTVHERARLQTFPKEYIFCGGKVDGRVQTGNAVPPNLSKSIAQAIKKMPENKGVFDY